MRRSADTQHQRSLRASSASLVRHVDRDVTYPARIAGLGHFADRSGAAEEIRLVRW
jgi:hypothetical protein